MAISILRPDSSTTKPAGIENITSRDTHDEAFISTLIPRISSGLINDESGPEIKQPVGAFRFADDAIPLRLG